MVSGGPDLNLQSLRICSVTDATSVPASTGCVSPAPGKPAGVPSRGNLRGVEVSVAGRVPSVRIRELTVRYAAADRKVTMLLPSLEPRPSGDGCLQRGCPSFELTPRAAGSLAAQAIWPAEGSALLEIRTAITAPGAGLPGYRVVSSASSSSPPGPGIVATSAAIQAPTPSSLVLTNTGAASLEAPVMSATWP